MTEYSHTDTFEQRLAKLDLTPIMKRVANDTGLPASDLEQAEHLYRKFLTLKALYPEKSFVPPRLADIVWHTHIIYTRRYMADCNMLFGSYLHHTPDLGAAAEKLYEENTVALMQREFGIDLHAFRLGAPEHYSAADCQD